MNQPVLKTYGLHENTFTGTCTHLGSYGFQYYIMQNHNASLKKQNKIYPNCF